MAFTTRPGLDRVGQAQRTGLDVTTQAQVLDTVRQMCGRYNVAAICVSHDLALVAQLASRVAVMYAGRIVEQGATETVLTTPTHPYTERLLRAVPSTEKAHALEGIRAGQTLMISFRDPDYQPLDLTFPIRFRSATRKLVIAAMTPVPAEGGKRSTAAREVVSNIKVRYTVNSPSAVNIGSAVKVFEVVNRGDVPCNRRAPCSPDGYWKASSGSAELDVGPGNEFRNARASCIAGPCPFTRVDSSGYAQGGRVITASHWTGPVRRRFFLKPRSFMSESFPKSARFIRSSSGARLSSTFPRRKRG